MHRGLVWTVAFTPDGRQLISGGIDDLTVRETTSWKETADRLRVGQADTVETAALMSDVRSLMVSNSDGSLSLWDLADRQRIGAPLDA